MCNLVNHAKKEMELAWIEECEMQSMVKENVIELMEVFSSQGHSGSSAPYVLDVFKRLANFEVIAPLTGKDDEWNDISDRSGCKMYQNNRNGAVFKDGKDWQAYWIDGKIFRHHDGCCYTSKDSRVYIDFPWTQCDPEYIDVE